MAREGSSAPATRSRGDGTTEVGPKTTDTTTHRPEPDWANREPAVSVRGGGSATIPSNPTSTPKLDVNDGKVAVLHAAKTK